MSDPLSHPAPDAGAGPSVAWSDPLREQAFGRWLAQVAGPHALDPSTLR
ncbi:MAG: aminoglycoside phosphotransferase, partial [Comamonadaceae bacterium]